MGRNSDGRHQHGDGVTIRAGLAAFPEADGPSAPRDVLHIDFPVQVRIDILGQGPGEFSGPGGIVVAPDVGRVKLADRASNVQTLRNLPSVARQREYYAQTVTYIMPLAASRDWFDTWYATWQTEHRDLA